MKEKTQQKFNDGETVRTSKEDYGILTIKDSRWNGYTWMYGFKETEARMGEHYLSTAPLVKMDYAHEEMAPAPWRITADKDWIYSTVGLPNGGDIICLKPDMEDSANRFPANASAIVKAVNGTYGAGINPDAVPDMLDALKRVMEYFGDQLYTDSPTPKIVAAAIGKAKL